MNKRVACIAGVADAVVAGGRRHTFVSAHGMLAGTGICCPVSHGASTVGLIHYIPPNRGTAITNTDSIPQYVRVCSPANFAVAVDKFELKSIRKAIDRKSAASDAATVEPCHGLCDFLVQAHGSADPRCFAAVAFDPVHIQVATSDVQNSVPTAKGFTRRFERKVVVMNTRYHGDGMPERGTDVFVMVIVIPSAANDDVIDNLSDAIAQEESGGINDILTSEAEVRIPRAPGSDTEGVVEAQIATALRATIEHG